MNREDQRRITKNLVALRKTLQKDVDTVANKLLAVGVLSKDARNEIANVKPNIAQLKCGVLINKVLRSGPRAYEKFRRVLEVMGYHDLVDSMDKSGSPVPPEDDNRWQEEREKTFVIQNPSISERLKVPPTKNSPQSQKPKGQGQGQCIRESPIEEVEQLERMMTFVTTNLDSRESNKNKTDFKRDFKQRLLDESRGNEQLMGFFKTLRYNSFSLTSQSLARS